MSRYLLPFIYFMVLSSAVYSQLNGTYTVNQSGVASANNYLSLTSAVSDMTTGFRPDGGPVNGPAVSGPVTIRIAAGTGPYTEQITIPAITGASAVNTIRITGGTSMEQINFGATTTADRQVIKLSGARHIILDSLTLVNTGVTYGYGVHLTNLSDSNIVSNCNVAVDSTSTSANFSAITISGATVTTNGDFGNYNIISNNTTSGGYYGITMRGTSTTIFSQQNSIINNDIRNIYFYGIYSYQQNLPVISQNTIDLRPTASTTGYGIYTGYNDRFIINENNVQEFGTYGIYLTFGNNQGGAPTSRAQMHNNMIGGMNLAATPYGIYATNSNRDIDIFHNTVSLTSGNGRCLYMLTSGTGNDIRNNVFSITNSTTGYAAYVTGVGYVNAMNYNDYYAPGSSNFVYIGAAYTPATFVGGGGFNLNSINQIPGFTNAQTDLHITQSGALLDAGSNVGVIIDIDGDVRPMAPSLGYDMGADEFAVYNDNVQPVAMVAPTQPFSAGLQNVDVTILNTGLNTLTSATLNWQVNGVPQTPFNWVGSLAYNNVSAAFTIGTFNFVPATSYTVKIWTTLPNGMTDPETSSDTIWTTVCTAMSGTYMVGGMTPDFTTVNQAVAALQCAGVSGPVTIRLAAGSGPYNEQVSIPPIAGASAINTIKFTGGTSMETITFGATTTNDRHVIQLDGSDYIILDSLTIINTGATYGYGVHLTNVADNNIVSNCKVAVDSTSTASNFSPITISGATVATNGDFGNYNLIINNSTSGGYYGITMRGTSTTVFAQQNSIINNDLRNIYYYGIYSYQQNLPVISSNTIDLRPTATTAGYGIYTGYNDRFTINENNVKEFGTYGIYLTFGNNQGGAPTSRAQLHNNMVGGDNLAATAYGIYATNSNRNIDIFHNSVSITSGNGRCLYMLTSGTGNDIRNNVFSITNSTTGYAAYITAASYITTMNYNDYYAPGSANFIYIGAAYTPATFVGGGGFNANSLNAFPGFTNDLTDLHITQSGALYDAGVNAGVSVDIDGDARPLAPSLGYDIGADEFSAFLDNVQPVAIVSPTAPISAGLQNIDITILNTGLNTLTSATINWQINGAPQAPYNWAGSLAYNNTSAPFTIGTNNFVAGNSYTFKIWTTLPNGMTDPQPAPDTILVTLCVAMAGEYVVGGMTPDFNTINDAVDALVCGGVSAPVTIRLAAGAGPFNEQVSIPAIPNASALNTVKFTGGTTMETVTFGATTTNDRYVFQLDGSSYITLDSMTIINTGATYGYGVKLTNDANYNRVSNCFVQVDTNTTSSNFAGITISGATVATNGNHGDYNMIFNNYVKGGYYGITARGLSTTSFDIGNSIVNNTVVNPYYYGLYVYQQDTVVATGNTILMRVTGTTAAYGAYFGYTDRFKFNENIIQQSGTYGFYSIYGNYQGGTGTVRAEIFNNMIGGGFRGTTNYGMYITTNARNIDIYNNSVSMDLGATSRAFYLLSGSGNNVVNNSFSIIGSTSGYAAYVTNVGYINTMDHNNYYAPGSSNFIYVGGAYTPATYVGGGGFNVNSIDGDPNYVSTTNDLHISGGVQLYDGGTNFPGITTDIDGDARPMAPSLNYDIGADEYNADSIDVEVVVMYAPASGLCPDSNEYAYVVYTNNGILPVYNVNLTLQITGGFTYSGAGSSTDTLNFGESDTIVIGPFSSYPGGMVSYTVFSSYPGDTRPDNDTITGTLNFSNVASLPVGVNDTICTNSIGYPSVVPDAFTHRWFDDPIAGALLGYGDTLAIGPLLNDTIVYVEGLTMNVSQISTTFAAGNGCMGNMFDVTALSGSIIIDSLDLYIGATVPETVTLYYRVGTYLGNETTPGAWVPWDTVLVTGAGAGQPTLVITDPLTIPGGQLYGIYVTLGTTNIDYTNGTNSYSNTDISIQTGAGLCNPFGGVNAGRVWNGTIYYRKEACPSARIPVSVDVIAPPIADLGPDLTGCTNANTLDATDPNTTSYSWSTGATTPTIAVPYYSPGTFWVVNSNAGCSDADTVNVNINPYPNPSLGPDTALCPGDVIVLDPPDTLLAPSYTWSTGAVTSTLNVSTPGTYWLYMQDFTGCGATDTIVIGSNPGAGAAFTPSLISGTTWQFTDNSTGSPTTWLWNFGDSQTSTSQNPSHTYAANGSYTVTLIATNDCGPDTVTFVLLINVGIDENDLSTMQISPNPTNGWLYAYIPEDGDAYISVLDMNGKAVLVKSMSVVTGQTMIADLSTIASGMYIVRMDLNGHTYHARVVKK